MNLFVGSTMKMMIKSSRNNMRNSVILFVIAMSFTTMLFAESDKMSYKPKDGYVPDTVTAVKIAEAILTPIYGEKIINKEKPFNAELKDGVWVVKGTLNPPGGKIRFGGVAIVEISKSDGMILHVGHGK